jgi:hypothetical protein
MNVKLNKTRRLVLPVLNGFKLYIRTCSISTCVSHLKMLICILFLNTEIILPCSSIKLQIMLYCENMQKAQPKSLIELRLTNI